MRFYYAQRKIWVKPNEHNYFPFFVDRRLLATEVPQAMSEWLQAGTEEVELGHDTYVSQMPKELPKWRWAALVYIAVIQTWSNTRAVRAICKLAKEHIRLGYMKSIHNGEHRRFEC